MADDKNRESDNSGPALYYVLLFLPVILGIFALVIQPGTKPETAMKEKTALPSKAAPATKDSFPAAKKSQK